MQEAFKILIVVTIVMIFVIGMVIMIRIVENGIPSIEDCGRWARSLRTAPSRFWQAFTEKRPATTPKPRSAVEED